MTHGIRVDGAARYIGMPETGKDRYYRTRSLFTVSSLKRKQDSSAKSYGRISVITGGMDMISMPDLMTGFHHIRIKA